MSSSSLVALRSAGEASSAEARRLNERRRNIIVLIQQHLIENGEVDLCIAGDEAYSLSMMPNDVLFYHLLGYIETAEKLQQEAGAAASKVTTSVHLSLCGIYDVIELLRYLDVKISLK
jgi:hypothetical protein